MVMPRQTKANLNKKWIIFACDEMKLSSPRPLVTGGIGDMKPQFLSVLGVAFLTIGIPHLSSARIGETLDECQLRYGVMVRVEIGDGKFQPEYPQYCYKLGDVNIRVRLYNGRSSQEVFYVDDKLLTRQQQDEIRDSNSTRETGVEVTWDHRYLDRDYKTDMVSVATLEFDKVFRKQSGSGF